VKDLRPKRLVARNGATYVKPMEHCPDRCSKRWAGSPHSVDAAKAPAPHRVESGRSFDGARSDWHALQRASGFCRARQWANLENSGGGFLFTAGRQLQRNRQGKKDAYTRSNGKGRPARAWPAAERLPRPAWPPALSAEETCPGHPPLRLPPKHFVSVFTLRALLPFLDLRAQLDASLAKLRQLCDLIWAPSRTWAPEICRLVRESPLHKAA